ncbi:MAG: NAD(P)-binding protein [Alphaproteobacteria bacterium]|nr:NAD(P)-binding protein [Alphaproteobacteria bacterium]
MRPRGRGELDSLYFEYPRFAAPHRHSNAALERVPVAIVGAGPVGLVAALTLARSGVRSVVFEKKTTFNDGSRAICIARQSYHILDRLGVAEPFIRKSLGWTTGRSFYRGRLILEFEMPHGKDEKFFPMYNLQQQYIERFLWEAASARPEIEFRWASEAQDLRDIDNGVALRVADPGGAYEILADYVLAADGARSALREMRGLRLNGENLEGRYVIADLRMKHDYPTIRRALFDPPCNPGGTVLIHRQPDDIWRVDYQLKPGEDEQEALKENNVRAKVASILSDIAHDGEWELEWWSVYSANTLALDDYRSGRIFFIGDSAHIVPIFGVRGLNNGIADGENIGWKLARVIKGQAGPGLLDSYTPERRGATLDVFAKASKSARFMTPPSYGLKLMRDAALSLALSAPFAGAFANPRQMTPYDYRDSPLTERDDPSFEGGPAPGSVPPGVRLDDGTYLCDLLGEGFTVLHFGAPPSGIESFTRKMRDLDPVFRLVVIGAEGEDSGAIRFAGDPKGECAARFAATPGALYLIRPDMYVAGRWRDDLAGPAAALARILDRKEAA